MNSLLEHLDLWGEPFLEFAWAMLWQSSLLIAILLVLDFALRRRVRASVRYALWLVVIVKLLLPPTLAAPTSIAWWIRPAPTPKPQPKQYIVTYPSGERPQTLRMQRMYEAFANGALQAPAATLSAQGWSVVGSGLISFGLLTWMLVRWKRVTQLVRCASPATEALANLMIDTRRSLGLRPNVSLRLTDKPMSPAVCGLFRPVILLPLSLAEQLPPNQLRTVLLHELVHLKRGDVWVNFAQAVLQLAYWWHPLLWLANARIRRVREEAVDDTVMLALRDEAESYAPTLLEVAKLAFNRPLVALGLVGIMESRNSLRQRIERLMAFRPPRKASITMASFACIFAFAALAVPMGQPPVKVAQHVETAPPDIRESRQYDVELLGNTSYSFENEQMDLARLKTRLSSIKRDNPNIKVRVLASKNAPFGQLIQLVDACKDIGVPSVGLATKTSATITTNPQGPPAESSPAGNSTSKDLFNAFPNSLYDNPAEPRYEFRHKVDLMFTIEVREDGTYWIATKRKTLAELRDWLSQTVRSNAESSVSFVVHTNAPTEAKRALSELCKDLGVKEGRNPPAKGNNSTNLFTRSFRVDPNALYEWVKSASSIPVNRTNASDALRMFLDRLGVDLNPESGKSVFFSDRSGMLLVRATFRELDAIESAVQEFKPQTPQIMIEAKFIEMPAKVYHELWARLTARTTVRTNLATSTGTAILTRTQARELIKELESKGGVEIIAAPRVTTLSGRQAQIADRPSTSSNFNSSARAGPVAPAGANPPVRLGTALDVTPTALADTYSIDLNVTASVDNTTGNGDPGPRKVEGETRTSVPHIRLSHIRMSDQAKLWDGQTLVLGSMMANVEAKLREKVPVLGDLPLVVVLVTPTLIDPSGNRIHSEQDMPYAREGVLPQLPH